MITITCRQARRLRSVFQRFVLEIARRGPLPPLVFRTEGSQLRAQHRYHALAIEHVLPGTYSRQGPIAIPIDAVVDFEGRDNSPVEFLATTNDRTLARWRDCGVLQTREYAVSPIDALASFPETPLSGTAGPAEVLTALVAANGMS